MIRTATPADLPLIRGILADANDAPYDIDAVVEEKCFGDGFLGPPTVRLHSDAGIAVTCGKYLRLLAVRRDQRGRGIGSALIADSGGSIAAAEPGNYFIPGVLDKDAASLRFLRKHRFLERGETWNLHVTLRNGGEAGAAPRVAVEDTLLHFVRREFGPIWEFEVARARSAVWLPDAAFAVVEANNRGLGTFGPTGVARAERGKGHGRKVLIGALRELAVLGYPRAVIPWTDAIDFYRKTCGAEPAHRFLIMERA